MKLSRQSIAPAIRLARSYAASAPRPDVEYEAESSTAALRRQGSTSESQNDIAINRPRQRSRRGPKATALLKAQKLAKALQSAPIPSKSDIPLPSTTPPPPPTLADLEARKPDRDPPSMSSMHYDRLYNKLYDSVDKAFMAKQLYEFAPKLGVKLRHGRNKEMVVRGILKVWGWEDPDAFIPEPTYRKVTQRDWMLTKAELWLIMRDSSLVRPALDEGVRFSIPPVEGEIKVDTGMRTLRGNGSPDALSDLNERIKTSRDLIAKHTRLAKPGQPGLEENSSVLATISNASGAYLEPILGGSIRVSTLDPVQAEMAVSLLDQYNSYTTSQSKIPLSLITPSPTLEMSLYPHIPSSISSIPWQSIDKLASPLFRVRGVQPWETKVGMRGVAHREEKLDISGSYRITGSDSVSEGVALSERVWATLLSGEGVRTVARFGHLLFTDPNSDTSILSPSDKSRFTADTLSTSSIYGSKPVLLPTLPPSLIQYPIEGKPRTIRRLRYQSQSGQICDITYTLPPPPTSSPEAEVSAETGSGSGSDWHQELDDMMSRFEIEGEPVKVEEQPAEPVTLPEEPKEELDLTAFEARVGQEKAENFIMPDRPIDYTMLTSDAKSLDISEIPKPALTYLSNPHGLAPISLEIQGQTWTIVNAVEQIIHETDLSPKSPLDQLQVSEAPIKVTLRSINSTDLTFGSERVVRYAELETTGEISPVFWEQLAVWSRAVAPGAGSLRSAVY